MRIENANQRDYQGKICLMKNTITYLIFPKFILNVTKAGQSNLASPFLAHPTVTEYLWYRTITTYTILRVLRILAYWYSFHERYRRFKDTKAQTEVKNRSTYSYNVLGV